MKKILVPTDFSDKSENMLDYAVGLAKQIDAELILFHSFYQPIMANDIMLAMPSMEDLETDCWKKLDQIKHAILKSNYDLKITTFCTAGILLDEIIAYVESEHVNLIVVGTHGGGFLKEKIVGSTAASLIQTAKIPVLIVRPHMKFQIPKNIVLATDFVQTDNQVVLKFLKDIITRFQSHLSVLNVYQDSKVVPTMSEIVAGYDLDRSLKHIHHTFVYTNDSEVINGINSFVLAKKMDLVVMISRKHSVIDRAFREPFTKKMAFHCEVPFLALHA